MYKETKLFKSEGLSATRTGRQTYLPGSPIWLYFSTNQTENITKWYTLELNKITERWLHNCYLHNISDTVSNNVLWVIKLETLIILILKIGYNFFWMPCTWIHRDLLSKSQTRSLQLSLTLLQSFRSLQSKKYVNAMKDFLKLNTKNIKKSSNVKNSFWCMAPQ